MDGIAALSYIILLNYLAVSIILFKKSKSINKVC